MWKELEDESTFSLVHLQIPALDKSLGNATASDAMTANTVDPMIT
eukprot:CAMPEP_0172766912 /NCGR_PEP_ID=MMETSP1074-20121228/182081_1 /TAXON_ID=2916 /ORGANISM="Ceratium fusus, Strain PA161109" /LENGTH=44 /DNA_ID= /DNA_START= /DNA_END= /DNA_ORIENTATION=